MSDILTCLNLLSVHGENDLIRGAKIELHNLTTAPDTARLELRSQMWFHHGCSIGCLYGDDGEMQCNCCMIDFKRDSIPIIFEKLQRRKYK